MDEEQWLTCEDWRRLLAFVSGRWTKRKAILYVCAGLRSLWDLLYDERSTFAVEVAECMTDGSASSDVIANARYWAEEPTLAHVTGHPLLMNAASIAFFALGIENGELDERLLHSLQALGEWPRGWLVRELFGNPFCPIHMDPRWLHWNDAAVVRLTQAAYDERILPAGMLDNTRLFILADALEEAGCTDEQILTHLRSGGEHYRGCWVIDSLLGKN
jgi:hypothetical protein